MRGKVKSRLKGLARLIAETAWSSKWNPKSGELVIKEDFVNFENMCKDIEKAILKEYKVERKR